MRTFARHRKRGYKQNRIQIVNNMAIRNTFIGCMMTRSIERCCVSGFVLIPGLIRLTVILLSASAELCELSTAGHAPDCALPIFTIISLQRQLKTPFVTAVHYSLSGMMDLLSFSIRKPAFYNFQASSDSFSCQLVLYDYASTKSKALSWMSS